MATTPQLDYLPTRDGGADQLHTHGYVPLTPAVRENCGGCAQLANDFAWLRFHDAVADRRSEFGTVEEALAYAEANMDAKHDPRATVVRAREHQDLVA